MNVFGILLTKNMLIWGEEWIRQFTYAFTLKSKCDFEK